MWIVDSMHGPRQSGQPAMAISSPRNLSDSLLEITETWPGYHCTLGWLMLGCYLARYRHHKRQKKKLFFTIATATIFYKNAGINVCSRQYFQLISIMCEKWLGLTRSASARATTASTSELEYFCCRWVAQYSIQSFKRRLNEGSPRFHNHVLIASDCKT